MKTNHYKQQSIKLLGFITLACFSLFLSSCGTEKNEVIEDPSNQSITSDDILERVAAATQVAGNYYHECNSISELEQHLDEIRKTDGIVDVWTNDQTMYVKYEGWGIMPYYFPAISDAEDTSETRSINEETFNDIGTTTVTRSSTRADDIFDVSKTHYRLVENDSDNPSLVIYYACYNDESKSNSFSEVQQLIGKYESWGYNVTLLNSRLLCEDFYRRTMYDYDLVFILTHGDYCEYKDETTGNTVVKHWLMTGIPYDGGSNENWGFTAKQIKEIQKEGLSSPFTQVMKIKETVNGQERDAYYWSISEDGLDAIKDKFKKQAIVFNEACKSLKGPKKLGDIFCKKGASCFLGYDNTNTRGPQAGVAFFKGLLNGWSVQTAYKNLDKKYIHDDSLYDPMEVDFSKGTHIKVGNKFLPLPWGVAGNYIFNNKCDANLQIVTKDNNDENKHVCIVHPKTEDYENEENTVTLKGSIKIDNPENSNEYGFVLHSSIKKPEYKIIEKRIKYSLLNDLLTKCEYDKHTHLLNFKCKVDKSEFEDIDKFCAYLYDGERYCLGDFKDIKIQNVQLYAEYDNGTNTMTFRYGNKPNINNVYDLSSALRKLSEINRIVFDESVSNAEPESFMNIGTWFKNLNKVEEIVGLGYINSSLVTNMERMFEGCNRLKYLDLDGLNTSQVSSMMWMFMGCSSLTNINLGKLDTSNVIDMSGMFLDCISLDNIDLSNLDTSNVLNMCGMFANCNNLMTLNLSSFNTSQVKDMSAMFRDCTSLTTLDLSSFNTNQVNDMSLMFSDCTGLTDLNLSSFNTSQVTTMSFMFSGCSSLPILDLRSFDTSQVFNMSAMFYCCSSLTTVLHNFDTSNVIYKNYIFGGCDNLTNIGLFGK